MRVTCLAQEHNAISLLRAQTQTARSGVERANRETTMPLTHDVKVGCNTGEHSFSVL